MSSAAETWAAALAEWAIPEEIRAQAPDDPWKLSPRLFEPADPGVEPADTPSRRLALEALGDDGSVLDVGVGAGGASLHLAPPARLISGVDESEEMLAAFARNAAARGVKHKRFLGRWPDVARAVPVADVVMSHHVLYNVPDLAPFVRALTSRARRRVVVEIGARHPVSGSNPLWKHFWGLDRPERPTAEDALAVLDEAGIAHRVERDVRPARVPAEPEEWAAFMTRRLCLPPERRPEVEEAMRALPEPAGREVVTIWWDGAAPGMRS